MVRTRFFMTCCFVAAFLCGAHNSEGQIQQRSDGRLNDVNPLVGSGGYNAPQQVPSPNAGNLIVSGNVTGGRAFQGFSPIRNSNEFFAGLPSSTLANFRRDSIGLSDLSRGISANALSQPRAFYDPSRTILSTGDLERALPSQYPISTPSLYDNIQTGSYGPLNRDGTPLQLGLPNPQFGVTSDVSNQLVPGQRGTYPGMISPSEGATVWGEAALSQSVVNSQLFSNNPLLRRQQMEQLMNPAAAARVERALGKLGMLDTREDPAIDTSIDRRLSDSPIEYAEEDTAGNATFGWGTIDEPLPGMAAMLYAQSPSAQDTYADGLSRQVMPGADSLGASAGPFADTGMSETPDSTLDAQEARERFLQQARDRQQAELEQEVADQFESPRGLDYTEDHALDADAGANAAAADRTVPGQWSLPHIETRQPIAEFMYHVSQLDASNVETFVGATNTDLNKKLRVAEDLLKSGAYFEAASRYQIAMLSAPDNPIPAVGKAHALIGAGQYFSAVRLLVTGLPKIPDLAEFRIRLTSFIPSPELLDRRRADLEKRLAEREDPDYRFLLGYIEYYMGLEDYGLENLEQAAALSPSGSFMERFPGILRTRTGSEEAPTVESPPAEQPSE